MQPNLVNHHANEDHGLDLSTLSEPRMIAAMKVTGIKKEDLQVEPSPPEGCGENEMRRYEVKTRKRHKLVNELRQAAECLDSRDVEALLSGPGRIDEHTVFNAEKARIDKQRENARADLRRKAAWEVETQQAAIRQAKDLDSMTRRIAELRQEKVRSTEEKMEAKRVKVEANLAAAREKQLANRRKIIQKIQENDERVGQNIQAILEERGAKMGSVQVKAEEAARRLDEHEEKLQELAEKKHFNNITRMDKLEDWIDHRDQELARTQEERKANFSNKHQFVADNQSAQDQERGRVAYENLKKLEKAREHASNHFCSVAEKTKAKRTQRLDKWTLNQQVKKKERKDRVSQLRSELNTSTERSQKIITEYRDNTLGRHAGIREIYKELVDGNKERLDRSSELTRDLKLNRITYQKACTESREEQKKHATSYRVEAFRERVAGQTQVEELHDLLAQSLRASSPSRSGGAVVSRVNAILTDLGVPIPVSTGVAEGEEAEGGQSAANGARGHGEAPGK